MKRWEEFVAEHGGRARADHLAHVTGAPEAEIRKLRHLGVCLPQAAYRGKPFPELFAAWHGRAPRDDEWPAPRKAQSGYYEWLAPELALLASLVGRVGRAEIQAVLTERLRRVTGDPKAERGRNAVLLGVQRLGLQFSDVVGGITAADAAREIGSRALINHALRTKQLKAHRVGRLWVISRESLADWKAKRVLPPKGWVRLRQLNHPLGIRHDKLSEYARMGYVPTAIRCTPIGSHGTTRWGTWYIDPKIAKKLVADRRAGRPMPWHGKPYEGNLKTTWKLYDARRHPADCDACQAIWGEAGAPTTYEDYARRYPPLDHGAKRHLTRPWSPGMTVSEVARRALRSEASVRRAIENGVLPARRRGRLTYVSRTEAALWIERNTPTGEGAGCWVSLATAGKRYGFSELELRGLIKAGKLKSKIGELGAQAGIEYVGRHQCAQLRKEIGFTEAEAARRAGVSIARLRVLLRGLEWRQAQRIPLDTVNAAIKRKYSQQGYTVDEAAQVLGKPVSWVNDEIKAGTARLLRTPWDRRRRYLSIPMIERLQEAAKAPRRAQRLSAAWLHITEASHLAGVAQRTFDKWYTEGAFQRRESSTGWRYHRDAVMARAREYWKTQRFKRATPPAWLQAELEKAA